LKPEKYLYGKRYISESGVLAHMGNIENGCGDRSYNNQGGIHRNGWLKRQWMGDTNDLMTKQLISYGIGIGLIISGFFGSFRRIK